jgi:probable rRNA maturation factor
MSKGVKPLHRYIVTSAGKSPGPMMQRLDDRTIIIVNRQRTRKFNARLLRKIVRELFLELKISKAELGINLVGAKEMARVNEQFLQHEGSTDVITFDYVAKVAPAGRRRVPSPARKTHRRDAGAILHGELFVCVDEAVSQARHFQTSWQSEIVRYIVHGVLHLRGHDDLKPDLRRKMERAENRLVHALARRFSLAQLSTAAKLGT